MSAWVCFIVWQCGACADWASWNVNCHCAATSNEENESRSKKQERRRIKERKHVREKVKKARESLKET